MKESSKQPILSVRGLSIDFHLPEGVTHALRDVSFEIHKGETLALLGESGSGKSISAMSVLQLLPYPMARHPKGSIIFRGKDLITLSKKELYKIRGNGISMIFQEPMTALNPLQSIGAQVAEGLFLHNPGLSQSKAKARVLELLEITRVARAAERMHAYPYELSGGQRQRVIIAMALINNPDILIADEPTSALDISVQNQILQLLIDLQRKFGMAILFITHDLSAVEKIADRVSVMKDGQIVESGDKEQVLRRPKHPYTKLLLDSHIKGHKQPYEKDAKTILEVAKVQVEFPLKRSFFGRSLSTLKAVKDVSICLKQGQTLGIVGESGSGKSTLGKAILKLLHKNTVSMQSLFFDGKDINKISSEEMRRLRKDIQVVFQDPFGSLSPRMTVDGIIREGLDIHFSKLSKAEKQERIEHVLLDVALNLDMLGRFPHEFSGGQRQRIAIARAIVLRPKFLLLDEPTSALDRNVQVQVLNLLRDLQKKYGLTYLFISHDLDVVRAMSDDVIIMKNGEVLESIKIGKSKKAFLSLEDF